MKAVIIGGSSGIGLSIAMNLLNQGFFVHIVDRVLPKDKRILRNKNCVFHECNLENLDYDLFYNLSNIKEVNFLMITAGFGRVASFSDMDISEVRKLIQVNASAVLQVLHIFYTRINSLSDFYCGIMGSIAGLVSSPLFSVYAASKASLCRFIESVNIELECSGVKNRILNVSPGSIKGTSFNGGENDLSQTTLLAEDIIQHIFKRESLFIPDYEKTYKDVLMRYQKNPHEFGLQSYSYKIESGRVRRGKTIRIGYCSGTFDLFHIGHLNMLERAKKQCDFLIVGVHADASHKGKTTFIPFDERKRIISAVKVVDRVIDAPREDSDAWNIVHYDMLFVGSDYKNSERFLRYEKYFSDKGVDIVYFPYTQGTSSTQIREMINNNLADSEKLHGGGDRLVSKINAFVRFFPRDEEKMYA